jgi:integrase
LSGKAYREPGCRKSAVVPTKSILKTANSRLVGTRSSRLEPRRDTRHQLGSHRQVAKRALLTEDLRRIVRKLRVDRPGGCRDRAVLLVGFGAALRRSELIAPRRHCHHPGGPDDPGAPVENRPGRARPRDRDSAVTQSTTCPVGALEAWLELTKSPIDSTYQDDRERNENGCVDGKSPNETSDAAKVSGGFRMPLFTRVDHGRITGDRLTGRAVAEIVKRAARRVGIDPSKVAGHSLRSGFATSAARGGASLADIMAQTGHKNSDIAMRYVQRGKVLQNPASKAVRL